jgi:L-ascorbate metabolism protein UlaG (beta-lactamase superfamily)
MSNVKRYKQAGVRISDGAVVYIDPWDIKGGQKADLILITHTHFDHFSPQDIALLRKEDTLVVVPRGAEGVDGKVRIVKPGDVLDHKGVHVEAVPAYTINKSSHPKGNLWVGYVVTVGGKRYYHAGDTDLIPEMAQLKGIDVAMLPVGGTYTMNAREAAAAASMFMPRLAIPIHYGDVVGTKKDAIDFKALCKCPVEVQDV